MRTRTAPVRLSEAARDAVVDGAPPSALGASLAVAGGLSMGVGIAASTLTVAYIPMSRYAFVVLAMCAALLTAALVLLFAQVRMLGGPGTVRYVAQQGCTWFTQSRPLPLAIGVVSAIGSLAIGGYSLYAVIIGLYETGGNVWRGAPGIAWVFAPLFLAVGACLVVALFRYMRSPLGIRIAPDGLTVTQFGREARLRWNQLAHVRAVSVRKPAGRKGRLVPCVKIEAIDGRTFTFEGAELGSDSLVVAAFLHYHREHPAAREWLVDPEDALRRFRAVQQP